MAPSETRTPCPELPLKFSDPFPNVSPCWRSSKAAHDKSQIERRELIMMCYLNHDTYRVRGEGPAQEGRRSFTVDLNRSGMVRTTTMTTVQGPAQRYYVEQDTTERSPLEAIKISRDYLHELNV